MPESPGTFKSIQTTENLGLKVESVGNVYKNDLPSNFWK